MNRRQFTASFAATAAAQSSAGKPNILLILSDDHSVPNLGVYGNKVIKTPNLDRFAREGMLFHRMFTTAPQCVPSRTGIMTGRSPVAVRMGRFSSPLPPDIKIFPEHLRAAGYFTGICRRTFHLDGSARLGGINKAIFDKHGMMTFDSRVDYLDRNSPRAQTKAKVNEFLDKKPAQKPFFLWVSFNDPHHPWDADAIPQPHDPAKIPLPAHLPDLPGVRDDLGRHYDEISRADEEFQWIMDILEKRGFKENTIVIFMGDNGMAFPHGKGSLYDPGLNVPLAIRWPGNVKPGTETRELISGEDLAPTMLEAAGITPPKEISGQSFLKLLRGETSKHRDRIFAARLTHGSSAFTDSTRADTFDQSRCVRTHKYKLIYNCTPNMEYWPVDSGRDPGWQQIVAAHKAGQLSPEHEKAYFQRPRPAIQFYDLEKDPSELHDIAGKPEHAAAQRELLIALTEKMITDYDFLPLPINE